MPTVEDVVGAERRIRRNCVRRCKRAHWQSGTARRNGHRTDRDTRTVRSRPIVLYSCVDSWLDGRHRNSRSRKNDAPVGIYRRQRFRRCLRNKSDGGWRLGPDGIWYHIERNQQMFSDLNRTVQKTSRSLDILYDHRDPMNRVTLGVSTGAVLVSASSAINYFFGFAFVLLESAVSIRATSRRNKRKRLGCSS